MYTEFNDFYPEENPFVPETKKESIKIRKGNIRFPFYSLESLKRIQRLIIYSFRI